MDNTTDAHKELLASETVPEHIKPFLIPKLVREGSTVRLVQYRFDERQQRFCWQSLAQPVNPSSTSSIRPYLRLPCPSIESKHDFEEILWFLLHHNTRPDGTYYIAVPAGTVPPSRGYGSRSEYSPTTECKLIYM